jgi:peptidyl-prolyl cis-trans isomerase C
MSEQVEARHILIEDAVRAETLHQKILDGFDFAELARDHSKCPSGQQGGNLGTFGRGVMVPDFENVAFNLPVGSVSMPFQTPFGWHIVERTG